MAVVPICEELQLAYLAGVVENYSLANRKYNLEPLFPEVKQNGTRFILDVLTAGRGRGTVKTLGAPTHSVQPDSAKQLLVSPTHFGENMPITDEEMSTLRMPGSDMKLDRARIVQGKVGKLVHRWRGLRQWMTAQALGAGQIAINENGVVATVNYGIPTLANPATWANAAAKIHEDIQAWISDFQTACGRPPKYVFFNPRKIKEYFMKNTALPPYLTLFERSTVERFFASLYTATGALEMPLFGLTWVPFAGMYEAVDGDSSTLTDDWPEDSLTFVAEPDPGSQVFAFYQSRTAQTDNTGGPVADSVELMEPRGQMVVRVHANGIPAILQEGYVMRVADVAP